MNTIIACSSGNQQNVAISIVRLSGFESLSELSKFFSINLDSIKPKLVYFTKIVTPLGQLLDEINLVFFKGPNSYNGENILELYVHGNKMNVQRIINLFVGSGIAKLAQNGEFTLRALRNKKLSLSQVEGLNQFLNSTTEYDLKEGMSLLSGSLNEEYTRIYDSFKALKIYFEIEMDFSDDVGSEQINNDLQAKFKEFSDCYSKLHARAKAGKKRFLTLDICLFGLPNSGKSTFFNTLLNEERAIVSASPGTTRDYISEFLYYKGNEYKLVDTAGVRKTDDEIERHGVARSKQLLSRSFFKLLVVDIADLNKEYDLTGFDLVLFTKLDSASEKSLKKFISVLEEDIETDALIVSCGPNSSHELEAVYLNDSGTLVKKKEGDFNWSNYLQDSSITLVSNDGDALISSISSLYDTRGGSIGPVEAVGNSGPIGPKYSELESGPIGPKGNKIDFNVFDQLLERASRKLGLITKKQPLTVSRHIECLECMAEPVTALGEELRRSGGRDLGLLLAFSQELEMHIDELVGAVPAEDVLAEIFSSFCIGK